MIERETVQQPRTISVIKRVECDRCGRDFKRVHGIPSMDREFEGAFIRGDLYPTQNIADREEIEIDVCASCVRDLCLWVQSGING